MSMTTSSASIGMSFFHLTHLLKAGISPGEALLELSALEGHSKHRRVWGSVSAQVATGSSLSKALGSWPQVFDEVSVALVRAGEVSGKLGHACEQVCELNARHEQTRVRIVTALFYPLFAVVLLIGVIGFLFVSVVPSLEGFLLMNHAGIAWHTRSLLSLSGWLQLHGLSWLLGIALVTCSVLAARRYSRTCQLRTDRWMMALPLIGPIQSGLSLGRYARVSAQLYQSGIDLSDALLYSEALVSNTALRQELCQARGQMLAGSSLGSAMSSISCVSGSFKRLVVVGESAGALGKTLSQAGEQHELLAGIRMQRIEKLIGPVMLVIVGMCLLWLVISILGPVYGSAIDVVVSS